MADDEDLRDLSDEQLKEYIKAARLGAIVSREGSPWAHLSGLTYGAGVREQERRQRERQTTD